MSNKPNWLTTFENTVGSIQNSELAIESNEEEPLKSANSGSNTNEPNWVTTFKQIGSL